MSAREKAQRGKACYDRGEWPEAIAAYEESLRLRPEHPLTHFNLGLAYYKNNQKQEARREWQMVLTLAGDRSPYLVEQTKILLRQFG